MIRHIPYIIGYDASGLTDGATYPDISIPTDNVSNNFFCRGVSGWTSVLAATGTFRLIRMVDQPIQYGAGQLVQTNLPLVPQVLFLGPDLGINVQLDNVLRANNAGTPAVYTSQLAFHGAIVIESGQDYEEGKWRTAPFWYDTTLTLNWKNTISGVVQPARTVILPINDYPFELLQVAIYNGTTGAVATDNRFAIQIENASNIAMQNMPITNRNINAVGGWDVHFPCLPVLYPANSQLTYSITSLVPQDDATTYTYRIVFTGRRRIARW